MSETDKTTTQGAGAETDAQTLRDVPGSISEYSKFKADGGLEHNQKVAGHDAAVKAAKAAGILPAEGEQGEEHKTRSNFQRRVSRLQRKIGERDAQIDELRKRIDAQAPAQNGNHAAPAAGDKPAAFTAPKPNGAVAIPKDAPRPKEEDFKAYSDFVEALADWKTDIKLAAAEAKRAEDSAKEAAAARSKAVTDAHNVRVDDAKTRYTDWNQAFKGLDDNSYTDSMVAFIFESDKGPDVTYYLATHRDELTRIAGLSPVRQVAALTKIEDQFAGDDGEDDKDGAGAPDKGAGAKAAKGTAPADDDEDDEDEDDAAAARKPKAHVTKAAAPAKPLGGRAAPADQMPDPKDFKAYAEWSKRQAAKGVKR
jgi:hypothetical protein